MPPLDGAILVENEHGHMFHVIIERVAERDHLDQRREKKEKKSQRIGPGHDEFLEKNCAKPAKQIVFHFVAPKKNAHRSTRIFTDLRERRNLRVLVSIGVSSVFIRGQTHAAFSRSAACLAESWTNTSSSDGPIS